MATNESTEAASLNLDDLLEATSRGDREAFAELYDQTCSRVFALALRVLRNREMAEEVTQEVYLQVWERASRYSSSQGKPLTWMLTICHRRAVDRIRSEEARKARENAYEPPRPSTVTAEDALILSDTLSCLTPSQREIIGLVYYRGCTALEAATILDVPTATAKTRLRDGLKRLREEWRR